MFFSYSTFLLRTMKNKCSSFGERSARSKVLLLHPRNTTENIFFLGQKLLSVFARISAFVFCLVFCSKPINSETCICISYILMGSKTKTIIFSYHNIGRKTSSVNNLILKIFDSDWKLEICILQFSCKVNRSLEAWKRPLESCPG